MGSEPRTELIFGANAGTSKALSCSCYICMAKEGKLASNMLSPERQYNKNETYCVDNLPGYY